MRYYDGHDNYESCPHRNLSEQWIDEAGWDLEHPSIWYEVKQQECDECGEIREFYHEEIRIEVTAREEMEQEQAA